MSSNRTIADEQQQKKQGKKTKTFGVILDENDTMRLNFFLQRNNFPTLGKFVKAVLDKKWPAREDNEQSEKLLERIRDRGIKDPMTGDFSVDFYKSIDKEDMFRDFYRKYIYKKHARDLIRYFERYSDMFFTNPKLIQSETGNVRAWICDAMRRFAEYYDRKYQNPEVRLLIDEIIKRYEINKKMKIRDRVFVADNNYIIESVDKVLKIDGSMGLIVKFAFFSGLRGEEITHAHETPICDKLSGCECENLHVIEKDKFVIVVLNRIMGQKRSYFTILPANVWSKFRNLDKVSKLERKAVHTLLMSHTDGKVMLMYLRKFHYNILCRSELKEQGAEVLQGRAKSISAKHYLIHELDKMVEQYANCMQRFLVS
ncbi:integrase [Candidatus Nitrosocosmicus sp. FF01]|uniref:integrase n=1 Tax=Candidatus Nitrosocosmicus sp. FF01 TaxID=3397670 RepID=UPI0039ECE978